MSEKLIKAVRPVLLIGMGIATAVYTEHGTMAAVIVAFGILDLFE